MQYKLLLKNVGDIIWIYNLMLHKFTFISPSIDNVTGYQISKAINNPDGKNIGDVIKISLKREIQELLVQRSICQPEKKTKIFTVLELVCKDNRHTLIEIIWTPVYDKHGNIFDLLGIGHEVPQQYQFDNEANKTFLKIGVINPDEKDALIEQNKLQKSRTQALKLDRNVLDMIYNAVDQNPDILLITDFKGKIEYINSAIIHETGDEPKSIIGNYLNEWFSQYYEHNLQYKYFLYAIELGQSWTGIFYRRGLDNEGTWEQITTSPVICDRDDSSHMSITIKNVNREKLLEEEQKKNKRQGVKKLIDNHDLRIMGLIQGEERERKRFASELHDGLGQILTAAKYCLEGLSEVIPVKFQDEFKICRELLGSAIAETRNISHGLMPSSLTDFGLIIALRDLCLHTLLINGHPIRFEYKEQDELQFNAFREMMIFRIVQEGINNIQKHAGATQATISLKRDYDQVVLSLIDNGLGFEINKSNEGLGLLSIRDRSKLLGGCCNIKSEPGKGTQIRVSFNQHKILN